MITAHGIAEDDWASNMKALGELYALCPEWPDIVGAPGTRTPWRQWLSEQPEDYQLLVNEARSPQVVVEAITKFHRTRAN